MTTPNPPKLINFTSPAVAMAAAGWIAANHNWEMDTNMQHDADDEFWDEPVNVLQFQNNEVSWYATSKEHNAPIVKTMAQFFKLLEAKTWQIGCKEVKVNGGTLVVGDGEATVDIYTVEQILAAMKESSK